MFSDMYTNIQISRSVFGLSLLSTFRGSLREEIPTLFNQQAEGELSNKSDNVNYRQMIVMITRGKGFYSSCMTGD